MTLMETAQVLGNFGEFLGAIAVVLTLAYLTIQVRQNTQAIRFQTGRQSAHLISDLGTTLMQPNVVDSQTRIYGTEPEKLSDEDFIIHENMCFSWLAAIQQDHVEYQSGLQSDEWWASKQKPVSIMMSLQLSRNWWENVGKHYWTPDFQSVVNKIIDDTPIYSYLDELHEARPPSAEQT